MPVYDLECKKCGHQYPDEILGIDETPAPCEVEINGKVCGGELQKIPGRFGLRWRCRGATRKPRP